jgi:hypothetical protein
MSLITVKGKTVYGAAAGEAQVIGGRKYILKENNIEYVVHIFTENGELNVINTPLSGVRYLIVGGGGGSDFDVSGGGGAGGYIEGAFEELPKGKHPVYVGQGGMRGLDPGLYIASATRGGNSIFNGLTALGGGAGGLWSAGSRRTGLNGGSGGGSSPSGGAGGAGTPGQGFSGGSGPVGFIFNAGGGGGAGAVGQNSSLNSNGGIGKQSNITGSLVYYAGGGGGGREGYGPENKSLGGLGGGGDGHPRDYNPEVILSKSCIEDIRGNEITIDFPFHSFTVDEYFYIVMPFDVETETSDIYAFKVTQILDSTKIRAVNKDPRKDNNININSETFTVYYDRRSKDGINGLGGGGGGTGGREIVGRSGGSGIVVIRYPLKQF